MSKTALSPHAPDISRIVLSAQWDIQTGQDMANQAGAIIDRRVAYQSACVKLRAAVAMLEELAERPFGQGGCEPYSRPGADRIDHQSGEGPL